jgi:predicted Holliday junction resolvase-like endonuclease
MDDTTLVLIVVILLILVLLYNKKPAEHATLADRLEDQTQNIETALKLKLSEEVRNQNVEHIGNPYDDVQAALNERRFENMCSPQNNQDEPLCESLHGGSVLDAM